MKIYQFYNFDRQFGKFTSKIVKKITKQFFLRKIHITDASHDTIMAC